MPVQGVRPTYDWLLTVTTHQPKHPRVDYNTGVLPDFPAPTYVKV